MIAKPWRDLVGNPEFASSDCQIWQAWLDEEDPALFRNILSPDESLRAARLRSTLSANRFCIARGILRTLLADYLATSPEQVRFSYGLHGKPKLASELPGNPSFNVAHSNGLAVFAIARGFDIGVDVEEIRQIDELDGCASIFLSPEELVEFKAFPKLKKLERFMTLWVSKEAILKAYGIGFSNLDKNIFATFREQRGSVEDHKLILKNKQFAYFIPAEGFKGALACL